MIIPEQILDAAEFFKEHVDGCKICQQEGAQLCKEGLKLIKYFGQVVSQPEFQQRRAIR